MLNAAPTLVQLPFSGPCINDFDQASTHSIVEGANFHSIPRGIVLYSATPESAGASAGRLLTGQNRDSLSMKASDGKTARVFEVQTALTWMTPVQLQGPGQSWGQPTGAGALWLEFWAVNQADSGAVTQATRSTGTNGSASTAARPVVRGRLLDRLAVVQRVPVSWTLQPEECLVVVARWEGWDFVSVNADGGYAAWLSVNCTAEVPA